MLDYLGNLMEDASDFSWEAAKASHAILLTNMEGDRLGGIRTKLIVFAGLMPRGISLPKILSCALLLKNQSQLVPKMALYVSTSKKVHVNFKTVTDLLVRFIGTYVRFVEVHTSVSCVIKNRMQKTRSYHTSSLMENLCTRYIYNSTFVNRNLLDDQYICKLKSVYKYSIGNSSYADVVKRKVLHIFNKCSSQQSDCRRQVTRNTVNNAIPLRREITRGKVAGQYGNSSRGKTGLYGNADKAIKKYVSCVNSIKPSTQVRRVPDNRFVHGNRFAILAEDVDSSVYNHSIDVQTVNRCQNNTRVDGTNGRKVFG